MWSYSREGRFWFVDFDCSFRLESIFEEWYWCVWMSVDKFWWSCCWGSQYAMGIVFSVTSISLAASDIPWALETIWPNPNDFTLSRLKCVQLSCGVVQLSCGVVQLSCGVVQLSCGVVQLSCGVVQLSGGVVQLSCGAVSRLSGLFRTRLG